MDKISKGSKGACWDCNFMDMSGVYFPGRCTWFREVKKEEPKEIPSEKVNTGCGLFSPKER
jgi:hypothetical protein